MLGSLNPWQLVMLSAGTTLFLVALGLLIYCVMKRRPFKPLMALFPIALIMIGFPSIKSFKLAGAEVELQDSLAALDSKPQDPAAKVRVERALQKVETLVTPDVATPRLAEQVARGHQALGGNDRAVDWARVAATKAPHSASAQGLYERLIVTKMSNTLPADLTKSSPPQVQTELAKAVSELSRRPNLSPESYLVLSKAQLALGRTNQAATNLSHALKLNTNLAVDPKLRRILLRPTPH